MTVEQQADETSVCVTGASVISGRSRIITGQFSKAGSPPSMARKARPLWIWFWQCMNHPAARLPSISLMYPVHLLAESVRDAAAAVD